MGKILWVIYVQPLHRIIALLVLSVLVWGVLGSRYGQSKWWKLANALMLLCISAVIVYATVYSRETGAHGVVLTPFQSFIEARKQPELYRSMLMNVFLFVPLGLSLPNVLPTRCHPAVIVSLTIIFGFAISAVIEWCQYRYGLGRCEVDDVIMNTFGTVIGSLSYVIRIECYGRWGCVFPRRKQTDMKKVDMIL